MNTEVAKYFESMAKTWDLHSDRPGVKHIAVAQIAGVFEGARVLDVGCGTGIMETALCACGARSIVALDLSETMIAVAKEKYHGLPVSFECDDVIAYSKRENIEPFDVVVIYNAYPHFMDKDALVEAVVRVLKPKGRFLVAHGTSKEQINNHHKEVPCSITTTLFDAQSESERWHERFDIDEQIDAAHLYCFGGKLKK